MTEAEWNACTDPLPMLEFLRGKASGRKLRLFATAYCRRIWHLLIDERSRRAIELSEEFADGLINEDQLQAARDRAYFNGPDGTLNPGYLLDVCATLIQAYNRANFFACIASGSGNDSFSGPEEAIRSGIFAATCYAMPDLDPENDGWDEATQEIQYAERIAQCKMWRCLFGPQPFRPAIPSPAWNTPTVSQLAESIYADRAFDALPILADALEDAGCTDADILNHCRQPGEHVRGCWVVDLLLGKK